MRALLVVASGCAFVVPRRGLAQRPQRRRPVAKGFYDEDDEHDEEPRPWADAELGGVRLQRLAAMTGVGAAAYTTYILGSEALQIMQQVRDEATRCTHCWTIAKGQMCGHTAEPLLQHHTQR